MPLNDLDPEQLKPFEKFAATVKVEGDGAFLFTGERERSRSWSAGLASARESLRRGLGSRWFMESFHQYALVKHFQDR